MAHCELIARAMNGDPPFEGMFDRDDHEGMVETCFALMENDEHLMRSVWRSALRKALTMILEACDPRTDVGLLQSTLLDKYMSLFALCDSSETVVVAAHAMLSAFQEEFGSSACVAALFPWAA